MTAETSVERDLPEGYAVEIWSYAGRRLSTKGGLVEKWIDHEGTPRLFKKLGDHPVIGGFYDVTCKLTETGGVTVSGEPAFRGGVGRDTHADEWALQDRAAYTEHQSAGALKRMQKDAADGLGNLTLNQVRRMLSESYGGGRTAMLAQILRHIGA